MLTTSIEVVIEQLVMIILVLDAPLIGLLSKDLRSRLIHWSPYEQYGTSVGLLSMLVGHDLCMIEEVLVGLNDLNWHVMGFIKKSRKGKSDKRLCLGQLNINMEGLVLSWSIEGKG